MTITLCNITSASLPKQQIPQLSNTKSRTPTEPKHNGSGHALHGSLASPTCILGFVAPSSEPPPLCPRFLPGRRKPRCDCDDLGEESEVWLSLEKSPNRDSRLFFFGFASSSSSPTSSKHSSSMDSGFSKLPTCIVEGDVMRESSDVRDGMVSV